MLAFQANISIEETFLCY